MTASAPVVIAHAGHWAVDLGIYLGPVVVIAVLLKVSDLRQKRRDGDPPSA